MGHGVELKMISHAKLIKRKRGRRQKKKIETDIWVHS
jgi:hypothetical protein